MNRIIQVLAAIPDTFLPIIHHQNGQSTLYAVFTQKPRTPARTPAIFAIINNKNYLLDIRGKHACQEHIEHRTIRTRARAGRKVVMGDSDSDDSTQPNPQGSVSLIRYKSKNSSTESVFHFSMANVWNDWY